MKYGFNLCYELEQMSREGNKNQKRKKGISNLSTPQHMTPELRAFLLRQDHFINKKSPVKLQLRNNYN